MLDAVVTVVDARHAMDQLDRHEEAQRQVGFADKILLSKTDLVDAAALDALKARLRRINPARRSARPITATLRWPRCSTCAAST
jgi:G3E family GTPase